MLKCFTKKLIKTMEVQLLIFFLNLGEGEGDENDDNNYCSGGILYSTKRTK